MQFPEGKDTAMTYSIYLALAMATAGDAGDAESSPDLPDLLEGALGRIRELVGRLRQGPLSPLAAAGFEKDLQQATRKRALARLRAEHGVSWGVKRLRQVTAFVAAALEGHRPAAQAGQVLRWLGQAQASRGPHRPVLSAGRDGITLGLRLRGCTLYEVATAGTLTVYDRRGRRLGTAYLARTPEPGQGTLGAQLTQLLQEVLRRWQGPLPRRR